MAFKLQVYLHTVLPKDRNENKEIHSSSSSKISSYLFPRK